LIAGETPLKYVAPGTRASIRRWPFVVKHPSVAGLAALLIFSISGLLRAGTVTEMRFRSAGFETSTGRPAYYAFTSMMGAFSAYCDSATSPNEFFLNYTGSNGEDIWLTSFGAGAGQLLATGTYTGAAPASWPNPNVPFISLFSNYDFGSGGTGAFIVKQLSLAPDASVISAWVTFVQPVPETGGAVFGDFRYNVDGSVPSGPLVEAGSDETVEPPGIAILQGYAYEFGGATESVPLHVRWSVVSGPGKVKFSNAGALTTTATLSEPGDYVLQLTASDGRNSVSSAITVSYPGDVTTVYLRDLSQNNASSLSTPQDGTISATIQNGVLNVTCGNPAADANMHFAAASGATLSTGTYAGATYYAGTSGSAPQMLVFSNYSRPATSVAGTFVINQLVLGASNTVTSLWLTFQQYGDGASQPVNGEIRYNVAATGSSPLGNYVGLTGDSLYGARLTAGKSGAFSAALRAFSESRTVVGKFSPNSTFWAGTASGSGPNGGIVSAELEETFDGCVAGVLREPRTATSLLMKPVAPRGSFGFLPGYYTMAMTPAELGTSAGDWGYGVGVARVDRYGNVRMAGSLPDGDDIAYGGALTVDGAIPYHQGNGGYDTLGGWVTFADLPGSDFSGQLTWVAESLPASANLSLVGCRYESGALLEDLTLSSPNAQAVVDNLHYDTNFTLSLDIGTSTISVLNMRAISRFYAPGIWSCAFFDSQVNELDEFVVVFLQKQNMGYGISVYQQDLYDRTCGSVLVTPSP
jgi:hypothetical protein